VRASMPRGARVGLGKECILGGMQLRPAVASGADAEAVRAHGRASRNVAPAQPTRFCFAEPLFEHK
jgi:hypothetical protein